MKGKLLSVLIVVLLLAIVFSGCFEDTSKKETGTGEVIYKNLKIEDLDFTIDNYPKTDSSTSAYPLNYIIACNILNSSYMWMKNFYSYLNYLKVYNLDDENISDFIESNLSISGTHDSYVNLIDGTADIILVARLPSEDELNYAKNNSVTLITKPIALDAFVFITNVVNPVESLSIEEIQNIYTGNITNWSQVGGIPINITAYQREKNSGSQELMETLVMKDLKMADTPELIEYGMGGPFDQLVYDSEGSGIAYTVYYYKEFLTNTSASIKMIGVNGVIPNYENISNMAYKYIAEVYAVIRSNLNPESNAYKLRDWLLGIEGQEVVKESGYVPILE